MGHAKSIAPMVMQLHCQQLLAQSLKGFLLGPLRR
jgi:hypothetical protein